jgi:hypothetical protein
MCGPRVPGAKQHFRVLQQGDDRTIYSVEQRLVDLEELEKSLPNGLHDADLVALRVDFIRIAARSAALEWNDPI